ncbi:MAG: heavy metal-responsive transcriptional regulator [Actinobacteria bacterium]|nr:heavy metal-responsive transcriptional regulator [Actinomycetota bacterium]
MRRELALRIGEVGDAVGVDPPTIRYYESVGVLPEPERAPSGYRTYSPADVKRLRFVSLARSLGIGLDDIRQILALRDRGEAPCGYVRGVLDRQVEAIDERILQLEALSGELRRLQRVAGTLPDIGAENPCVCHILEPATAPRADTRH